MYLTCGNGARLIPEDDSPARPQRHRDAHPAGSAPRVGRMTTRTTTGGPATGCLPRKAAVAECAAMATTLKRMGLVDLGYAVALRKWGRGWAVFVTQPHSPS